MTTNTVTVVHEKTKKIIYSFIEILKRPEMKILPGQLAFYFLMSIVPIVAIASTMASFVTSSYSFSETIASVLPAVFSNILVALANDMQFYDAFFILIMYILFGSNAAGSIIIASNVLYETEQPIYIKRRIKSFIMTLMIVILLLFVILIPLFGDTIMKFLMLFFDNIHMLDNTMWLYVLLKTFISFVVMYFIIKFLYTYAPSESIDKNTTIRGALFTTISWILATNIFSFYVTRMAKYKLLYGNFANILVLMLWIYLLALLFVVGMALNVEDFHKKKDVKKHEKERKGQEE